MMLVLIFYPYTFQFSGFDAITTGSAVIVLITCLFILSIFINGRRYRKLFVFWFILFSCSTVSTLSIDFGSEYFGTSFRRYVQFVTAISIMWVIANSISRWSPDVILESCEKLLWWILLLHASHVIIALVVYIKPEIGSLFSIFMTKERVIYEIPVIDHVTRLATLIMMPEAAGEMVVLVGPTALYFWMKRRDLTSILILGLITISVLLTVTRSTILLYMLAQGTYLFFSWQKIKRKQKNAMLMLLAAMPVLLILTSSLWLEPLILRMDLASSKFDENTSLIEAINRSNVWYAAFDGMLSNLSFFGNGMISIVNGRSLNFHSLYLTTIHQLGAIGGATFLGLLFYILTKAYSSTKIMKKYQMPEYALQRALVIGIALLYVNQIKYEFIRHSSYQQLVMIILAISYVLSWSAKKRIYLAQNKKMEKNVANR